jgi:hypothetical protein
MGTTAAEELLAEVQRELDAGNAGNGNGAGRPLFVDLVADGAAPTDRLAALACEELLIVPSDQRSFSILAARFPDAPAGSYFLQLAQGEGVALSRLGAFAASLELSPHDVGAYQPRPGCQAYPAYVAWLAVNGSRSQVATALLANLDAWGSYCARIAAGLREHYGLDDTAVAFFDFFATPPAGFRELTLSVVQSGLDAGEGAEAALPAARLLQSYERMFWDTLADGLDPDCP